MKIQEKINQKKLKSLVFPLRKSIDIAGYKTLSKDETGQPTIRVKWAVYGNKDSDDDIIIQGAFAKSINDRGPQSASNRKIAFLWQHDMKDPIGLPLLIEETDTGAFANIKMSSFDAVPNSYRAYSQMESGELNQFSFGFNYIWDKMEYDEDKDAFIIKEVNLHEISVVTHGANEMTSYEGILHSSDDLKSFVKSIKEFSPDRFEKLKNYIKELDRAAEPDKPLTDNFILSSIADKLIK